MTKGKNRSRFGTIGVAGLAVIVAASMLIGVLPRSTFDPFSAPATFQPVQTTRVSFDVFAMNDPFNPIGSIVVGETPSAKFSMYDPELQVSTYPRVGVFRSNAPYSSDAGGNPVAADQITTSEKRVFGDRAVFKHEAWFTYDLGARTYTALPASRTDTVKMITPVAGMEVTHWSGGPVIFNTVSGTYGYVPQGTMIVSVDMGTYNWNIQSTGSAKISQSLEPIDFDGERLGHAAAGLTFADAMNRLRANYGNTPVVVKPRITISAVNNFEKYTYEQKATLSNGTEVVMTLVTTNALVGFEDVNVVKLPWAGVIPKAYAEQFDNAGMDYTDPDALSGGEVDAEQPAGTSPLSALVRYTGDVSLPGGNEITRMITPIDAWSSIDMLTPVIDWNMILDGQNSLPETVDLCAEFDLQPVTTVKVANIRATGVVKSYYYLEEVTYKPYDISYQYPYALKIDNVASMYSFTMKVDLFTNNEVQMVTSAGLPVDISKLVDFDLGSVIGNPTADDMRFTVESVPWWDGFLGMFTGLFGEIIQVLAFVMVIVIVIGVVYVIAQFRKR